MVNKERILALADFIESGKYKLNMSSFIYKPSMQEGSCSTAACIAGHAETGEVIWLLKEQV